MPDDDAAHPFSTCDTPSISSQPYPDGEPCYYFPNRLFFRNTFNFLLRLRFFSRALGRGARRRLACIPRRKCGSRPCSLAPALCVRSREIRQVLAGKASVWLEPSWIMKTPSYHFRLFVLTTAACFVSPVTQQPPKAK